MKNASLAVWPAGCFSLHVLRFLRPKKAALEWLPQGFHSSEPNRQADPGPPAPHLGCADLLCPRSHHESKKITWKDGLAAIFHIFSYNIFRSKSTFYRQPWENLLGPVNQADSKPV